MTMPPVVAAFRRALARICGCHRFFTLTLQARGEVGRRCAQDSQNLSDRLGAAQLLTRYRTCGPALLGAGRVNAFCPAAS